MRHSTQLSWADAVRPGQPLIELRQVVKTYETAAGPLTTLKGIDLRRCRRPQDDRKPTGRVARSTGGCVFQFFQLLPTLAIVKNVVLPMNLRSTFPARERTTRALANDPPRLVADEPKGNLKSSTANAVFQLFQDLARSGKTIVIVTHERDVARQVNRINELADGQMVCGRMLLPNATLCTREVADA